MRSFEGPDHYPPPRLNSVIQQLWQQQTAQYLAASSSAYSYSYLHNVNVHVQYGQDGMGTVHFGPAVHGDGGQAGTRVRPHTQMYGPGLQQARVLSENTCVDEYGRVQWVRESLVGHNDESRGSIMEGDYVRVDGGASQHVGHHDLGNGPRHTVDVRTQTYEGRIRIDGRDGNVMGQISQSRGERIMSETAKASSFLQPETHSHPQPQPRQQAKTMDPTKANKTKTSADQAKQPEIQLRPRQDKKPTRHRKVTRTTIPSSPPNPPKRMRIKSRLESSPCPPPRIAPPKADSWANFSQRIDKDDKNTRREAKEQYEQLGGDKLRPEIRETYMNQKGKKEVVVHGRRGGEMKSRVGPRGQVLDDGGAEGGGVLL